MKVRDARTREVQLCTTEGTLKDAAEAMKALDIGHHWAWRSAQRTSLEQACGLLLP